MYHAHMYYTYVLRSKRDSRWYTGYTGDLPKRFRQHNAGTIGWTRSRGPFELIYYESGMESGDAKARERYLKSGPDKRFLKNRLKRFLSLTG